MGKPAGRGSFQQTVAGCNHGAIDATIGYFAPSMRVQQGGSAMAQADDLKASVKVCMFDQYGTVVDMQTGLTEVATPYLKAKGWTGNPHSFVTWWRRTHYENSMI